MAPEAVTPPVDTTDSTNSSTDDTSGQEPKDQQPAPTDDKPGTGEQQQVTEPVITKDTKLPDDHPVVKQLAADKAKLAKANTELAELRAKSSTVTKLEEELGKRPTTEALETLQTRYDRLESFLVAAGGPLSKALDSRSFTRSLFETDEDITSIVKAWQAANPGATAEALAGGAAKPGAGKRDPNELLRIAAGKA